MALPDKRFDLRTVTGETITRGGIRVTPESQALTVHLPFGHFVYHRPLAVVIEQDGQVNRIPIVDITRVMQLSMLAFSIVFLSVISRRFAR